MKRLLYLAVCVGSALFLGGCRQSESAAPPLAVVDLDVVAKAMGRDVAISRTVETATQNLNAQLVQAAQEMEKDLKQQKAAAGTSPTVEQQAKLRELTQRIQEQIQSNKEAAAEARQRIHSEQILLFRDEVKIIAARLALKRGAAVVLTASPDVIWMAPAADITAEVIAAMRARAAVPPPEEPPQSPATPQTNAAPASPK